MGCEGEGEGEVRWSRQQCVVGLSAVSGAEEPTCASPAAWPDGPRAPRTWRGKASADRVPSAGRASQSSARFVLRAARSGGPAAALPRRRLCACCYAATREPRSPLGSPRGSCRTRLARGGKEDERGGQGKVEAEDVGEAGGEGGLTARAEAAVNLREGARDVWRRGRGRGSGRAQSAVGSLHTCTLTLLEGDVIDEAACIDVRRIRLRAGTFVECTPGLGAGYGSGGASRVLSRGRCWDRSWGCDLAISTRSRCGARFADRACTGHLQCSRAGRTAPGQGAGWGWGGWWGGGELDA